MNVSGLKEKLIASARGNPPGDHVPYAFEKRIMALLPKHPLVDAWGPWAHGLTRAAVFCVATAALLGIGTFFLPTPHPDTASSQDFESALLAVVDNPTVDSAAESE